MEDASLFWRIFFSQNDLIIYGTGTAMLLAAGYIRGWHKVLTRRMGAGVAATLALLAFNSVFVPMAYLGVGWIQQAFGAWQIPTLPNSIWQGIPFWLIALFAIIAFDFVDYVNHRMMHLRWLWPIHAVHHSDHDLNAFTSFRVHFLEAFFMRGTYIVGLGWMGIPPEAAGIGAVYLMIHNMYVHTNIDWDHGPLNWLIASPRFHQWHHADKPAAYGKNLSNLCPMWDMMFGTYYVPGPCDLPTHTQEVEHASPISLILAPFQMWGRMVRRRFGKAVPLIHSGERN